MWRRAKTKDAGEDRATPLLEIQIHPGDIRKRVRYYFLTRRLLRRGGLAVALYVAFLLFSLAVTPRMIRDQLAARHYRSLTEQRTMLGERLHALVERFDALEQATDDARVAMAKIHMAYGLPGDEAIGLGGYPFAAGEVPASIYASTIRRGKELEARVREQLGVLESFLTEVQEVEEAHRDQVRITPSISPLRGEFVLTSPFGNRRSPFTKEIDFHNGIDLAAAVGTPIHAPADGQVIFAGWISQRRSVGWWRYGKLVAINHGDRFITLFAHCDEIHVKRGQRVMQGEVIGTVGNTGWSTSPHLHYEVRRVLEDGRDEPKDPRIYILDHRWRDEEQVLVRARAAPDLREYEPLPRVIRRR